MTNFEKLSLSEIDSLKNAIVQITILIAAADGKIDHNEIDWAEKLTEIRSYAHKEDLREFYDDVHNDFQAKLEQAISQMNEDTAARNEQMTEELRKLNPILAKLDNNIAFEVYKSFVSFAHHIAKASGGFMRFMSVSKAEEALINLPMLDVIILEEEEEAGE